MRTLMLLIIGTLLITSLASAGIPAGSLISVGPVPAGKTSDSGTLAGLLDCSGATEVSLDNVYYGDNTGLISNVSGYSCGYWYEPGGEVVYHLYLPAPAMWEATLEGSGCDLDLAVLDQCDEDLGCVALVDATVRTTVPVSGDIYFVVDGYDAWGCPFTLTLTSLPLPPLTDFCARAEVVPGTSFVYGYTCTAGENLISSLDCSPIPADGLEAYYRSFLTPGSTVTATVTHAADGILWLLGGCVEPFTCLAHADAGLVGDPEVITYTNGGAETIEVYLVIDSYGQATCASYDADFVITSGPIPVQTTTFGGIKAMFR